MSVRRILILVNAAKRGAQPAVAELAAWLNPRVQRVDVRTVSPDGRDLADLTGDAGSGCTDSASPDNPPVDLCLVLGGDGTLLWAARMLAGRGVPLVGVNIGKLGFLAEFSLNDIRQHLPAILAGRVEPTRRLMLRVCISGHDATRFCSVAANDIVIAAGPPFRMIDLHVLQDGRDVAHYRGDGLILATPTGSTGYNMSAGGPILHPTMSAVAITPIAPHSLSVRPILIGPDHAITVRAHRVNAGSAVMVDGQATSTLDPGDTIEVTRAPHDALIIPHPDRSFFQTLSEKLQWAKGPNYQ